MTHAAQLTDARRRAADPTRPAAERRWWADHVAYLEALPANRAEYRDCRAKAADYGLDAAAFDAAVLVELDEDEAGNDSSEWVRAARWVLTSAQLEADDGVGDYEPPADWEDREYRRHLWARSCDAALDDRPW
jgi:hypothetical protein